MKDKLTEDSIKDLIVYINTNYGKQEGSRLGYLKASEDEHPIIEDLPKTNERDGTFILQIWCTDDEEGVSFLRNVLSELLKNDIRIYANATTMGEICGTISYVHRCCIGRIVYGDNYYDNMEQMIRSYEAKESG